MAAMAPRDELRRTEQHSLGGVVESAAGSDLTEDLSVTQDTIARQLRRHVVGSTVSAGLSQRELEDRRIRSELESVWNDCHLESLPPSGREFDPVPDPADESAYDALEKAYNLAFGVSDPERLKRSEEAEGDRLVGEDTFESASYTTHDTALDLSHVLVRKRRALEREELSYIEGASSHWKREEVAERKRLIDRRRDHRELDGSSSPSKTSCAATIQVMLSGPSTVLDRAKLFASTRASRLQLLQHLAEACRSRVLGRARMRHHGDNGYMRPSTLPLSLQIPPQLTEGQPRPQTTPNDEASDTMPAECKAVAEFLAAQLILFAESQSQGHPRAAKNRVAALASHQLWRDQQRALADSEFNAIRLSNHRGRVDESNRRTGYEQILNPFQQAGEVFDSAWKTSLKRVEYGDWQLRLRADPCSSRLRESAVNRELQSLYTRGLNVILVDRGEDARSEIALFLVQVQNAHAAGHIHLVAAKQSCIAEWDRALAREGIDVLRLCRLKGDRGRLQNIGEGRKKIAPRVVLCSVESMGQDINPLAVLPLHLCVFDIDCTEKGSHLGSSVWMNLMALKCRQRVLLSQPTTSFDVRELALFAYPAALCSRRKILAWNCAALNTRLTASMIDAVNLCTVVTDHDKGALSEWNAALERNTVKRVQREERTLDILTRDVAAYSLTEDSTTSLMSLSQPEVSIPPSGPRKVSISRMDHTVARRKEQEAHRRNVPVVPVRIEALYAKKLPTKRRRRSSKSRKRISRCGECSGCLAEDCMKCGHCQDMKKYGGPGLRKQSCKRRKCLNPKTWGLKRKRTARDEDASLKVERETNGGESSDVESSDVDSLADVDNGENSTSSVESDDESSTTKNDRTLPAYDSDSNASSHLGDEVGGSAHGDSFDNGEDSDIDEPMSESGNYSRAGRSRVMRCGKCRGCTSGDCMKCIHCQDMKKYGGPGLRKQSCKNRKCIAPKVVLLNKMREKQDAVGEEAIDGEQPLPEDDIGENQRTIDVDVADLLHSKGRLDLLDVVQECVLVVRKFQFFKCDACLRVFTSQKLLELHYHDLHDGDGVNGDWERDAEDFLLHPAHQLACLLASRRSINPNWQAPSVRAYAKLEGAAFEYFFLKPFATLGRLSRQWSQFYAARGMTNRKGLSGGSVDCHVGDDGMIANRHALIQWDHANGFFTIKCLSFRSSLSVNGRDVHYSSRPLRLHSQDLVQIGATTVYFLLPTTDATDVGVGAPQIPRADVRTWLDATVTNRRASAVQDEAIYQASRMQL